MIPKIIHQIWIGDASKAPHKWMNTWKDKNPSYTHIFWNEVEIIKRGVVFSAQHQIDIIPEINGKADIMRWELLLKYGGIYIDADSICIEPLDDEMFLNNAGFATYENEFCRAGLVATGTVGFIPNNQFCHDIVNIIMAQTDDYFTSTRAWATVGPGLLTKMLKLSSHSDQFSVYPSYMFLPTHFTGKVYDGHKKVYAYQKWGTANQSYKEIHEYDMLPDHMKEPTNKLSISIVSKNTKEKYLKECFDSIRNQLGFLYIEVVIVDDGSNPEHIEIIERCCNNLKKYSRFLSVVFSRILPEESRGVSYARNYARSLCTSEIVFVLDSDDIMTPLRLMEQGNFMILNPDIMISGGNADMFQTIGDKKTLVRQTNFEGEILWTNFIKSPSTWIMNHSSICYRRNIEVFYDEQLFYAEDLDFQLQALKKYGKLHNMKEVNTLYRIHDLSISSKFTEEDKNILATNVVRNLLG